MRGLLAAADTTQGHGEVFFLGGTCQTWRALGEEIARQMGTKIRDITLPRHLVLAVARLADVWARLRQRPSLLARDTVIERLQPFWVYDSSKAYRTFGYAPQVSLAQGVAETLQWYRNAGWL